MIERQINFEVHSVASDCEVFIDATISASFNQGQWMDEENIIWQISEAMDDFCRDLQFYNMGESEFQVRLPGIIEKATGLYNVKVIVLNITTSGR